MLQAIVLPAGVDSINDVAYKKRDKIPALPDASSVQLATLIALLKAGRVCGILEDMWSLQSQSAGETLHIEQALVQEALRHEDESICTDALQLCCLHAKLSLAPGRPTVTLRPVHLQCSAWTLSGILWPTEEPECLCMQVCPCLQASGSAELLQLGCLWVYDAYDNTSKS